MDAIATFLAMGGYAAFVWSAYGITAVVLLALLVLSWRGVKARQAELDAMPPLPERGERRRPRAPDAANPSESRA